MISRIIKTSILFFLIGFLMNPIAFAQKEKDLEKKQKDLEKQQKNAAKMFINNTIPAIKEADRAFKAKKKDTGGCLAKAYDNELFAMELYKAGNYEKALLHAAKARKFCFIVIKENKGKMNDVWEFESETLFASYNKDKEFHKKMFKTMRDLKTKDFGELEMELDPGYSDKTESDVAIVLKTLVNLK